MAEKVPQYSWIKKIYFACMGTLNRLFRFDSSCLHTFYAGHLDAGSVVVDLGANIGHFARDVAVRYGVRVLAVEASLESLKKIPVHSKIEKIHAAVTDRDGPVTFYLSENSEANSLCERGEHGTKIEVPGLSLPSLMEQNGIKRIHLLKIDIEGAEIRLFDSLSEECLNRIDQITVEFHDFLAELNIDEGIRRVEERLERLGFLKTVMTVGTHIDCLFVHPERCRLAWAARAYLALIRALVFLRLERREWMSRMGLWKKPEKYSSRKKQIGILISGSGTNMENLVKKMQSREIFAEPKLVLSDNPEARGIERAARLNVPVAVVPRKQYVSKAEFEAEIIRHLESSGIDLVVLAGFMRILSPEFVRRYKGRLINIHPSLLPAFPGAHGIRDAFQAKVKETGVTVHYVDEGVDSGPVILQRKVAIDPSDTLESLETKIHAVEYEIYPEALRKVLKT